MTGWQRANSVYPFLFAVIFRLNLRWHDRKRAMGLGVHFLTCLSFTPLVLVILALCRQVTDAPRIGCGSSSSRPVSCWSMPDFAQCSWR